jgi:hypothetical protein
LTKLVYWLQVRGLVWTCLCPGEAKGHNHIALISHQEDGDTILKCAQINEPCRFECECFVLQYYGCVSEKIIDSNLTEVRDNTSFIDHYDHIIEGQEADDYDYAVNTEALWVCVEDDEGWADSEAQYDGWCGWFDSEDLQLEYGNF